MTMLVEALVQAVTGQVVRATAQEAQFAFKLKNELEQMEEGLGTMKGLVVDADKKLKQVGDQEMVKKYLTDKMGGRLTHLVKYLIPTAAAAGRDNASDHMSQQINSDSRQFIGSQDFRLLKTYGLDGDIKKLEGWILDGK
ncbi:hypothetical protein FF1_005319 [Malus domestica]